MYFALVALSFRRMTAYRGATVAGLITNFFFGLLRAYMFMAAFAATGATLIAGYSETDAITYSAITQALIGPLYLWGWWEVAASVRTGEIAVHLARPYDYFAMMFARDMGRAGFELLFRGAPMLILFPLLFDLSWPADAVHWAAVGISVALAVMVGFTWRFLVNISAIWFHDAVGVARMGYIAMTFFSGFLVPVAWFPDWLQAVVRFTPMPAMVNTPVEVYLGLVTGPALVAALVAQAGWFVVMAAAGRALFERGRASLIVQGG